MGQTPDEITQHLAERLCWQVAHRDETRIARRLYRQHMVDGVYRLDEGALLDDFFHIPPDLVVTLQNIDFIDNIFWSIVQSSILCRRKIKNLADPTI